MNVIKLLLFLALVAMVFHFWDKHAAKSDLETANISPNGFVALPAPTNLNANTVIVLAAENCPKEDARRADQLAEELGRRNIPYTRAHSARFDLSHRDPVVRRRLDLVMKGSLPIVFVNGKGKANPTLDEVVSEYETSYK